VAGARITWLKRPASSRAKLTCAKFPVSYVNAMTVNQVIALWPSDAAFAADAGITINALRVWRHRNIVPPKRMEAIIQAADRRGIPGIDFNLLHRASKRKACAAGH
jgi:hypothetical protein